MFQVNYTPDGNLGSVQQQLKAPLDYVSRQIIKEAAQAFAIGGIYFSTDSQNPSSTLGYGSWERWGKGRMIVSLDESQASFDTVEETGGEKEVTLTIAQMPQHTHAPLTNGASFIVNNGTGAGGNTFGAGISGLVADASTAVTGSSNAHNNMPPYITAYVWRRIA